ncbi:DUF4160 domain-containing protein [Flavobacterium sp. j3]|uniref:DUF4160 domain-containing protein n=1 Tax=Flavobacterium aureirubrum TaxID=3133147 RepID=A0ABU9N348_9FLAO
MYEIILTPILNNYFSNNLGLVEKERIATLGNMQIIIYSNDHNPPHFHVKSKDLTIDAKFKIENCEYISGTIASKEIKIVEKFYNDVKVKMLMNQIWSKK